MVLSAIYLLNWFYSFWENSLSLICFCNWKKKKKNLFENTGQPNPTRNTIDPQPDWPDPIQPTRFVTPIHKHLLKKKKIINWVIPKWSLQFWP